MAYTDIATWGVSDVAITGGVVQEFNEEESNITAPFHNEIGQIIRQSLYDKELKASATVSILNGTSLPESGESITIRGKKYYVGECTIIESNQDYKKCRLSLKSSAKADIVEKAEGSNV